MNKNNMKKNEVLALVNQGRWYHAFEIFPGLITPGICRVYPKDVFQRFGLSSQLTGKRVLEIGTWDGPYAFELESRGADVVATDIQDPDRTGFNIGKKILNARVKYICTNVYDLTKNLNGKFDIVLFMGVFYHLKYPILAFEQINKVLKDDGVLLFEGECFSHYAETLDNRKMKRLYRLILGLLAHSDIPMTLFYSGSYKNDISNWHIPNVACLKSWLITACFKVTTLQIAIGNTWIEANRKPKFLNRNIIRDILFRFNENQRVLGTAVKTNEEPIIEHRLV